MDLDSSSFLTHCWLQVSIGGQPKPSMILLEVAVFSEGDLDRFYN